MRWAPTRKEGSPAGGVAAHSLRGQSSISSGAPAPPEVLGTSLRNGRRTVVGQEGALLGWRKRFTDAQRGQRAARAASAAFLPEKHETGNSTRHYSLRAEVARCK